MTRLTKRFSLFLSVSVLLGGCWVLKNSRAGVEQAEYKVVLSDGKHELRDYPELALATTPMSGDGMNGGFGRLFRYITGANEGGQEIAMTTPVLIQEAEQQRTMSFIMPKAAQNSGPPRPTGERVSLRTLPAERRAVLRFSGGRSVETEAAVAEQLRAWITQRGLTAAGAPVFAYYDPPWTPTGLRRNEVMIRVEAKH